MLLLLFFTAVIALVGLRFYAKSQGITTAELVKGVTANVISSLVKRK